MTSSVTVRRALESAGLVPLDAQVLLAHVLRVNRAWLAAHGTDVLPADSADAYFQLAQRRRDGEPVAYLTATREFWGLNFHVTPDVLIPRPETETLVELALARLPSDRAARVLDLGTGTGAIALAIARERPLAHVVGSDVSAAAIAVASDNATRLSIANVEFVLSDWYRDLSGENLDLIVANPPYIGAADPHLSEGDVRFEPALALTPGADGLAALRVIVAGARARLVPGGMLAVEHGFDQSERVRELFAAAGFARLAGANDLAGWPRVVAGDSPIESPGA